MNGAVFDIRTCRLLQGLLLERDSSLKLGVDTGRNDG